MTIEQAGEQWRGTTSADLETFIGDHGSDELEVAKVVRAVCSCGHTTFEVTVSDDEDAVRRECSRCGTERLMFDSAARWDAEDEPDTLACSCEGEVFEVVAGVAPTGHRGEPWAVIVGTRCVECGLMGLCADWNASTSSLEDLSQSV